MFETARTRIAGWCAQESGAARLDRIVLAFGLVAVTGLLVVSMIGREASQAPAEAGRAASAAPGGGGASPRAPEQRVVSATGRVAPEPPVVEGVDVGPSHVSPSYLEQFEPRPDIERAILSAQTERAVAEAEAARAAAGVPAPEETAPETGAASGTDGS